MKKFCQSRKKVDFKGIDAIYNRVSCFTMLVKFQGSCPCSRDFNIHWKI